MMYPVIRLAVLLIMVVLAVAFGLSPKAAAFTSIPILFVGMYWYGTRLQARKEEEFRRHHRS